MDRQVMKLVKAEDVAAAMVVLGDKEYFVVGSLADVQKLYDEGFVERVWDIRLDNGHRPYPSMKKRINYTIPQSPAKVNPNSLTIELAAGTGLSFSGNFHPIDRTYLFRETDAFWDELWVAFSEDEGLPSASEQQEYHAVYRGAVLPGVSNIKFKRI